MPDLILFSSEATLTRLLSEMEFLVSWDELFFVFYPWLYSLYLLRHSRAVLKLLCTLSSFLTDKSVRRSFLIPMNQFPGHLYLCYRVVSPCLAKSLNVRCCDTHLSNEYQRCTVRKISSSVFFRVCFSNLRQKDYSKSVIGREICYSFYGALMVSRLVQ